jgi:hypothetical protein
MRTIRRTRTWEKFVRVYMAGYHAGETARGIGEKLNLNGISVGVYAGKLRKKGVKLPKLSDRVNVARLNGIILNSKGRGRGAEQN